MIPTKSDLLFFEKLFSLKFILQCNLGQAGELSIWEFSGVETYHMIYDHFIGNTNCIHTIVFNVEDSPEVQLNQLRYWFHFLQSRIPPVEPLGNIKFQLLLEMLSCFESETKA